MTMTQKDYIDKLFEDLTELEDAINTPSECIITNILNFARSYEVLETQKTGYVELNLN